MHVNDLCLHLSQCYLQYCASNYPLWHHSKQQLYEEHVFHLQSKKDCIQSKKDSTYHSSKLECVMVNITQVYLFYPSQHFHTIHLLTYTWLQFAHTCKMPQRTFQALPLVQAGLLVVEAVVEVVVVDCDSTTTTTTQM